MNEPDKKEIKREREAQDFILKWAALQFAVPLLCLAAFPDHMQSFFNDSNLGMMMFWCALWNLCGVFFYLFFNGSRKIAREVERLLVLVVFFAPTTSLLFFGPMLYSPNVQFRDPFKEMQSVYFEKQDNTYNSNYKPIFFARHDIVKDSLISRKDIQVYSQPPSKYQNAIVATIDNFYGDANSGKSILGRKVKVDIQSGAPILNTDIEPPY